MKATKLHANYVRPMLGEWLVHAPVTASFANAPTVPLA
jgi:hypothetical protein